VEPQWSYPIPVDQPVWHVRFSVLFSVLEGFYGQAGVVNISWSYKRDKQ